MTIGKIASSMEYGSLIVDSKICQFLESSFGFPNLNNSRRL